MKRTTLSLMRHAKSSWKNQNQSDHDRPLNERGNRDAPEMANRLKERQQIPDVILCSTARRTRETTAHLLSVFGEPVPQVVYSDSLYLASPSKLLTALHDLPDTALHAMIVAHNPGMEELSSLLCDTHSDIMPTCAIRQFSCACTLSSLAGILSTESNQPPTMRERLSAFDIRLEYSDFPKSRDS